MRGRGLNTALQCCVGVFGEVLKYQSMMLVERAAQKPSMLKLISVAVQRARPAMTGNRDRFTHSPVGCRTTAESPQSHHYKLYSLMFL